MRSKREACLYSISSFLSLVQKVDTWAFKPSQSLTRSGAVRCGIASCILLPCSPTFSCLRSSFLLQTKATDSSALAQVKLSGV
eukprot:s1306_g22.t1